MAGRIQLRRGTSTNWTTANPVLDSGEMGVETNTGRAKIGDGTTAWTSLPYIDAVNADHPGDTTDAHMATAIGFTPTGTIAATTVQAAVAEVATDAAAALASHEADTTNVHGISDTSALETTTGAASKVSTHAALTSSVHGISAFGATLVDDADASTARSTLGLGSIATLASSSLLGVAYCPATSMVGISGSPSMTFFSSAFAGWFLDAASQEWLAGSILVPNGWSTYNVDLVWGQQASGSGDVVYRFLADSLANGENASTGRTDVTVTLTAPSSQIIQHGRLITGTSVAAGSPLNFVIIRVAADAADTLPNDSVVLGLLLTKAS